MPTDEIAIRAIEMREYHLHREDGRPPSGRRNGSWVPISPSPHTQATAGTLIHSSTALGRELLLSAHSLIPLAATTTANSKPIAAINQPILFPGRRSAINPPTAENAAMVGTNESELHAELADRPGVAIVAAVPATTSAAVATTKLSAS